MTTVGIPGHGELAYCFDPQGDVVNRFNAGDAPLSAYNNVQPATDTVVWDAWGESLNDQWGGGLADVYDSQYTPVGDPSGFEAQFGYQGEWDNNLPRSWTGGSSDQYYRYEPYLLGRRYFDPSTGRFFNRDPIDYAGGENLYGYAGDNPVNEVDRSGEAPTLTAAQRHAMHEHAKKMLAILNPIGNSLYWFVAAASTVTGVALDALTDEPYAGRALSNEAAEDASASGALGARAAQAAVGTAGGQRIALGVGERLDQFASAVNGATYKEWGSANFPAQFTAVMSDTDNSIHFDLTSANGSMINPMSAAQEGARGLANARATSWELSQVYQHPDWWPRTTFYFQGKIIANPFER